MTTNEVKKGRGRRRRRRGTGNDCLLASYVLWAFHLIGISEIISNIASTTRDTGQERRERENTARTGEEAAMRRSMFDLIAMANVEGSRVIRCVLIRHSIKADSYLK